MAKTIFEELGGKYERQGDYLIPCLTVPAEEEQPIGTWGWASASGTQAANRPRRQDYILSLFWFLIRAISIKIILKSYVILNEERGVIYEQ